ncbi:MAG: hypothetical protein ACODAU_12365 [Myxococcota bacterium]
MKNLLGVSSLVLGLALAACGGPDVEAPDYPSPEAGKMPGHAAQTGPTGLDAFDDEEGEEEETEVVPLEEAEPDEGDEGDEGGDGDEGEDAAE